MKNKRDKPYKFVPKSYARSDDWAVSKIKEYLIKKGYTIHPKEEEDYELDIKATKERKEVYFEVETKTGYAFTSKEDFKFDTVSFLARKKKWAATGFWYIIVCRETLAFLMCSSKEIYKDEYLEVLEIDSPERRGKDQFYRVPKDKCLWYILGEVD